MKKKEKTTMETGDYFKNGARLKSRMSKGNIYVLSFIVSTFLLSSCQTVTISGGHAILTKENSFSTMEIRGSQQFLKESPVEWFWSMGGVYNISADASGTTLGAGLNYSLSKKRLQPYLGIRYAYSGYFENKGEDNEISHTYQSAIPSVGLRYFIRNSVSLNLNLGYQIGYSYFDESFSSGFMPSIGIGFALFTKHKD